MHAKMLHEPRRMSLVELPDPLPGPGEVVVRVEAGSMCGSDFEGYRGIHPQVTYPRVLGHEFAGTVIGSGDGVRTPATGTRVCGQGGGVCRCCEACRAGRPERGRQRGMTGFTAHGAYAEHISAGEIPMARRVRYVGSTRSSVEDSVP
jgi:L-gulonate 5-dehydrogenase